ncbi:MAG TPA: hypothetical protein VIO57_16140 [Chloroflexota bacterium]
MVRRVLLVIPVLGLFFASAVIVLAARAPRTWASHWTNPATVSPASGAYDYGAVRRPRGGWDLLWADDASQTLVFTERRGGRTRSVELDSGDVSQADMVRVGNRDLGVWVRNDNGRTVLMGATLGPGPSRRVAQLLSSSAPLEHPRLVRTARGVILLFSWQLYGNFDIFLSPLNTSRLKLAPRRLTKSAYYSFYPRAIADTHGVLHMLHLESCCGQKSWHLVYDRFDLHGNRLGADKVLATLETLSSGGSAQWPMDLAIDRSGHIWGAYAGDAGLYLFEASSNGALLRAPFQVDTLDGRPNSLSLALGGSSGFVAWEQSYDLGTYIVADQFDAGAPSPSSPERAVYASGSQLEPRVFVTGDAATIMWESTTQAGGQTFQTVTYRTASGPTLAQRVGLGLGNPWEEIALLVLGALGFATLTTTVNILWVLVLTAVGILTIRLFRWLPSKWLVYACVLAILLFFVFVSPGAPILFLDTLPATGLAVLPFGLMAFGAVLGFVIFVGEVPLRRIDDAYRAGLMAFFGMYFFAFVEAVVFIQQRLGYI